jgi:hypothetical protein
LSDSDTNYIIKDLLDHVEENDAILFVHNSLFCTLL